MASVLDTPEHARAPGDTVVRLVPKPPMVNQTLIETLESLLEYARNGELESVATACVWQDRTTSYGFTKTGNYSAMVGAISRLQFNYLGANET